MTTGILRRAMLHGAVVLPSLAAIPALAVDQPEPSDLARACLWAIAHRDAIDAAAYAEGWNDERLDHECRRVDEVITRAIQEPSASLGDLGVKARLALEDFERFSAVPGQPMDDGDRIVLTVLREAIALCA